MRVYPTTLAKLKTGLAGMSPVNSFQAGLAWLLDAVWSWVVPMLMDRPLLSSRVTASDTRPFFHLAQTGQLGDPSPMYAAMDDWPARFRLRPVLV